MSRIAFKSAPAALALALTFAACGDDDENMPSEQPDAGVSGDGSMADDSGMEEDGSMGDASMDEDAAVDEDTSMEEDSGMESDSSMENDSGMETDAGAEEKTAFTLTIRNRTNETALPTPFAPGVFVVHTADAALFADGAASSPGLEALAEDGNIAVLLEELEGATGVVQVIALDAPVMPGMSATVEFEQEAGDYFLSFATMYVQSNDLFFAFEEAGVPLFDADGSALLGELSDEVLLWNAGTELDEPLGFGRQQAPRQAGPNTGAAESVVHLFDGPTRALPLGADIVDVRVTETDGTFTVAVTNRADGILSTPIAPVFWATHGDAWSFFTVEGAASEGLELLAEDGSPMGLVAEADGVAGVGTSGAAAIVLGGDEPGPAGPGQTFEFSVTPDMQAPSLSFAAMVVESNDVFLALDPEGVRLLNDMGMPRSAEEIEAEIAARLDVWDAGTEVNQIPGAGKDQPLRQAAGNTGVDDPQPGVRRYRDNTNDLEANAGGLLDVSVSAGAMMGQYEVTVRNGSVDTDHRLILAPVVWATHDADASVVTVGSAASAGLEALAEDGMTDAFVTELNALEAVNATGVMALPTGADAPGPLMPGAEYTFMVMANGAEALSLMSMVVPSNDLFWTGSAALRTETGMMRSATEIEAELNASIQVWDAGTEANQPGAAGVDQAPRQSGAGVGAPEGDGTVRIYEGLAGTPLIGLMLE